MIRSYYLLWHATNGKDMQEELLSATEKKRFYRFVAGELLLLFNNVIYVYLAPSIGTTLKKTKLLPLKLSCVRSGYNGWGGRLCDKFEEWLGIKNVPWNICRCRWLTLFHYFLLLWSLLILKLQIFPYTCLCTFLYQ